MQHCKAIYFVHPFCGLQKEFNLADVGGDFGMLLLISTTLGANHFYLLLAWNLARDWFLIMSRLHKRFSYIGEGEGVTSPLSHVVTWSATRVVFLGF